MDTANTSHNSGERNCGQIEFELGSGNSHHANQMRPTPGFGSVIDTEYIMGLGTVDERMLILIDIEKLMSSSDMGLIEKGMN